MEKCSQCLCVPARCGTLQCDVCSQEKCCTSVHAKKHGFVRRFFTHSKELFAAALGIELLCIAFAELGANVGFYQFGFNTAGIAIAYVLGYSLAGAATFFMILGGHVSGRVHGCCSVLEFRAKKGFYENVAGIMRDFATGVKKLSSIRGEPELGSILRASLVILVTAESACILVAETVDLVLYQYSILLSIPLALFAGAFTIVAPHAYRKARVG